MNLTNLQLTFDDEFNSFTSSPDGSVGWMTRYPFGGENARTLVPNHELEYYSDTSTGVNPFSDANGVLDISANPSDPATTPYHLSYTSGAMTTYQSFSQLYGYFEIRAELPLGRGLWPAFWMLPADNDNVDEIDVFEMIGSRPNTLYNTIHDNVPGEAGGGEIVTNGANMTTAFHTYGVDWEPTTTTFYMDGVAVAQMATPPSMDVPMYMLVNLAVGGVFPGSPNSATQFPATMQVDYVRAYATAATTAVSGTAAITLGNITGQVLLNGVAQSGVTVLVIDASGNTVATAASSATGAFAFSGIQAGAVRVQYTLASGKTYIAPMLLTAGHTVALAASSYVAGATLTGSVVYRGIGQASLAVSLLDGSGNVVATTTTTATGAYQFIGLGAGSYQVDFTAPSGKVLQPGSQANISTGLTAAVALATGQSVVLAAEALVAAAGISGTVLLDGAVKSGVTVTLEQTGGTVVATQTTNSVGGFNFTGLQAGAYQLLYKAPAGAYLQAGSEANSNTGLSPAINLAVGQQTTVGTEILLSNPAMIQGVVHHYGASTDPSWGSGQGGLTVVLVYASGAVVGTTVTGSNGWFAFGNLAAGSYQLLYVPPAGLTLLPGGVADPTSGLTSAFSIVAGQTFISGMGAVISTTGISGTVLLAGVGEAGVSVSLLNASGVAIRTATTGIAGAFAFNGLSGGTYSVHYTPPTGQTYQLGSAVSIATGTTSAITLAAGAGVGLAAESLVAGPANIQGSVHHYGSADPSWGTGQSDVSVALLDSSGNTIATTVSTGSGWFMFSNLAAGNYSFQYSAPAGETLQGAGPAFTVTAGQTLWLPIGTVVSSSNTFTLNGGGAVALRGDGSYVVTGNAASSTLVLGAGNSTVNLTGGKDSVTVGAGNAVISLAGTGNRVTIGVGNSTVQAGAGSAVVQAGGGNVTITAGGANNLFDSGAGANFLNSDGSAGNVFMLNATGQGLTTISGFNVATTDVLDLARTLAGTNILASLSNVGDYVTASASGGNTTLYVDPTGTNAAPFAFASLTGVTTSVSQLLAGGHLSIN